MAGLTERLLTKLHYLKGLEFILSPYRNWIEERSQGSRICPPSKAEQEPGLQMPMCSNYGPGGLRGILQRKGKEGRQTPALCLASKPFQRRKRILLLSGRLGDDGPIVCVLLLLFCFRCLCLCAICFCCLGLGVLLAFNYFQSYAFCHCWGMRVLPSFYCVYFVMYGFFWGCCMFVLSSTQVFCLCERQQFLFCDMGILWCRRKFWISKCA